MGTIDYLLNNNVTFIDKRTSINGKTKTFSY